MDPTKKNKKQPESPPEAGRVAKVIARAGICSRRDAEKLIEKRLVKVNGAVISSPALNVTDQDKIVVEGRPLPSPERVRVWIYHKPKGEITSVRDPEGRRTVFDSLPQNLPRLQPVGRLDFNSEGLLLFTNDGGIKRRMELPSTGWKRRYRVRVHGIVKEQPLKKLAKGMTLEDIRYGPIEAKLEHQGPTNAWLLMGLREGKNREIRRVCEALGLVVNRLIRISYGPFQLGDIPPKTVEEIPSRIVRSQLGLDEIKQASSKGTDKGKRRPCP